MVRPSRSPRGLFDPYYVPSKLLHRDRELDTINGVYRDSYEDNYGINCLVHGISGVGRTVFSRYFLTKIVPENFDARTVYVDARSKGYAEIVTELNDKIAGMSEAVTVAFDLDQLWIQFKRTAASSPKRTVFVIDNIDDTNEEVYAKLARLSKEINASTIGILNSHDYRFLTKVPATSMAYDFELPLDTYTQAQLYEIIRMRVEDTFPLGLTEEVLRYITDIVCEFDASKPKTSIEALKVLWPLAQRGQEIDSDSVRAATSRITTFGHDQDYMDIIDTISMNDFMTLLVLEAMTEHLMRYKTETYIDRQTLSELVMIKCEELDVKYSDNDIERSLQTLIFQSVVFESGYSRSLLYTLVPPEILHDTALSLRRELVRRK
ncbi:MAG: orc1/cdc6 family replication initiation protein [Candidatus Thorarchaeota archaeon]|nr:MAG: orc1/cdc6 family replication initiation protein [Candidatus Thorarchaeota archaeon]